MRLRGVTHVDLCVLDFERAIEFYDRMFGWLGFASFSTLGIEYTAIYYTAFPHSYVGIHPAAAQAREPLLPGADAPGVHHVALWARSRREVDRFHAEFLVPERVEVTDAPAEYSVYTPGYYAVFFRDTSGIRWELARIPFLPTPAQVARFLRAAAGHRRAHPEWRRHPFFEAWRKLPRPRARRGPRPAPRC